MTVSQMRGDSLDVKEERSHVPRQGEVAASATDSAAEGSRCLTPSLNQIHFPRKGRPR